MGRRGSLCVHECVSVGGGYPEAQIVIDWPGRTMMQIHSSRLMFCHSALSAIKLAPVLKSPADTMAEAEITLHFPRAFLHLHPATAITELHYILDFHFWTFPTSRLGHLTSLCTSPVFFHTGHKVVFKSMPSKSFNHFLVVVLPQN